MSYTEPNFTDQVWGQGGFLQVNFPSLLKDFLLLLYFFIFNKGYLNI